MDNRFNLTVAHIRKIYQVAVEFEADDYFYF